MKNVYFLALVVLASILSILGFSAGMRFPIEVIYIGALILACIAPAMIVHTMHTDKIQNLSKLREADDEYIRTLVRQIGKRSVKEATWNNAKQKLQDEVQSLNDILEEKSYEIDCYREGLKNLRDTVNLYGANLEECSDPEIDATLIKLFLQDQFQRLPKNSDKKTPPPNPRKK